MRLAKGGSAVSQTDIHTHTYSGGEHLLLIFLFAQLKNQSPAMDADKNGDSPKHCSGDGGGVDDSDWRASQGFDGDIDANYPNPNMRRFRASKNFKNPPQPHMCIREKTIDGQEIFINVLSWTRIANPTDKNSPIPLFGGKCEMCAYA